MPMPAIWLIDAYRAGERAQVRALVDALGWPCEIKRLRYRGRAFLPHVLGQSTVRGLTPGSRRQLRPPWPDLVVSCGVRNEPVCRWIRERSGGRTRYVHVGRPWGRLAGFDLVVTTPQYRVPDRENVLQNRLTLHRVDRDTLREAARDRRAVVEDLSPPYVGVVVGGDSGPFTFGRRAAARLGREASALARRRGGSLLITTSPRTSAAATEALREHVHAPGYFYAWREDDAAANPYPGILGLSHELIVTADSIAMLSEACATAKPVWMFDPGGMRRDVRVDRDFRLTGLLYAALQRWFWRRLSRDITLVHEQLTASGRAAWLGDDVRAPAPDSGPDDMERAVAAVGRLLGEPVAFRK